MLSVEAQKLNTKRTRVVEVDFRRDRRWEDFVALHPDALIYHHPNWLAALESEFGQKCVSLGCEDETGELRAILPLFYTKGLPLKLGRNAAGRRLSSLPRTPVAGPLALDPESMAAVLRRAVELASETGSQLEIKTRIAGLSGVVRDLVSVPWRFTYVQELPSTTEGSCWKEFCERLRIPRECGSCKECRRLRFGNAKRQHRINWAVNKAAKLGLQVREAETLAELEQWYGLYLETMRHNAIPPRPFRFFISLWSLLRPRHQLRLLLAELKSESGTRLVAGSILLAFGQTVFYAFTGCSHRDFSLHPHDIIQLDAIRDACKNGFRWYDFGEVAEDHETLAQFKSKWGTEAQRLYRYYYPAPANELGVKAFPLSSSIRRVWRFLPLRQTALLGDRIYRYM